MMNVGVVFLVEGVAKQTSCFLSGVVNWDSMVPSALVGHEILAKSDGDGGAGRLLTSLVLGAIPLEEFTIKVHDVGGISVLQCPSLVLTETPRNYGTQSVAQASFCITLLAE